MTLKERKQIANMPHFSLGSAPQTTGYQRGNQIQTPALSATPGYDLNQDVSSMRKN